MTKGADYFDRDGKPLALMQWGRLFDDPVYSLVEWTRITDADNPAASFTVSTAWMGLDLGFAQDGPPLIFETKTSVRIQRSALNDTDEVDITDIPAESEPEPVNPEQAVINAIDELERDEIDDIVDWQIEQGRERGDGPGTPESMIATLLASLESMFPGRDDDDDEPQTATLNLRAYATLEEAREGHRRAVSEVAAPLTRPVILGAVGKPGVPRKGFKVLRQGLLLRHCDGRCAGCISLHPYWARRMMIWAWVLFVLALVRVVATFAMPAGDVQAIILAFTTPLVGGALFLTLLAWRFREMSRPLKRKDLTDVR